jgi:LysR family transcriptional regulator (chromosome initiation inhibitor)
MLPELQAHADLDAGRLERLSQDVSDVPLYWQRWRVESARLAKLTEAVRRAARTQLRSS